MRVATSATEWASVASVLRPCPVANIRIRADSFGGTSITVFGSYALAEYERARQMATLDLIGLDQMRSNAGAITSTTPAALNPGDTQLDQP